MQINAFIAPGAPVAFGAIPTTPLRPAPDATRLAAPTKTDDTALGDQRGRSPTEATLPKSRTDADGDHVAPPTIMQLKLAAIRSEIQSERRDAEPGDASSGPGATSPYAASASATEPVRAAE
ncbi:hypothetical protein SAMN05421759_1232 [Roseivivax lentus]|uniref:Uncharacterized protein n=1 Tax=Roseivivax lentus TaxID=633194 RepID=A0A1N7PYJ7_9RHOB|nr:hypothetical protein [Roseivivax lentus]SIT15723.1 hypothetical protein SAMN05421759_1232 [Roseivivax lentus]